MEGTGDNVIEKMSDGRNVAELLVEKFGETVNTWIVEASTFRGSFAVYKEFIAPAVDSLGNPTACDYDPDQFPASSSIVHLLSNCTEQARIISTLFHFFFQATSLILSMFLNFDKEFRNVFHFSLDCWTGFFLSRFFTEGLELQIISDFSYRRLNLQNILT